MNAYREPDDSPETLGGSVCIIILSIMALVAAYDLGWLG